MTDLTEKTLAAERKYTGKIISVDLLDIELPDGRKATREGLNEESNRPIARIDPLEGSFWYNVRHEAEDVL